MTIKLSPHFTLGEMTKTKYQTKDGNIPSRVAIENLKRICEEWLEDLRFSYNELYGDRREGVRRGGVRREGVRREGVSRNDEEEPIIINSGYRSAEVNRLCGGAKNSNHLTGCAVDIRCLGLEQAIRYASILLDIADGTKRDYDELFIEKHGSNYWIHFAVRPKENRRKVAILIA